MADKIRYERADGGIGEGSILKTGSVRADLPSVTLEAESPTTLILDDSSGRQVEIYDDGRVWKEILPDPQVFARYGRNG